MWRSRAFWLEVAPDMHCCGAGCEGEGGAPATAPDLRRRLAVDGFATVPGDARCAALAARCADAVERLAARRLPPICVLAYDEAWALIRRHAAACRAALPEATLNYDCYAWRVPYGARGWAAHRDRAGCPAARDGAPAYATVWVALTDVGPETACVWAAPLSEAPTDSENPIDLERRARGAAVPLRLARGAAAIWGGRTVHWGGEHAAKEAAEAAPARVSLAFALSTPAMADDDARRSVVRAWSRGGDAPDDLDARLRLIALQLHFYTDAAPLDAHVEAALDDLDAAWAAEAEAPEADDADPPRRKKRRRAPE